MKRRSVDFLAFPSTYYKDLRKRLQSTNLKIKEDLDLVEKYGILMDFDSNGYLLQIFTKPVQSRPTFFIEIIQRHNFQASVNLHILQTQPFLGVRSQQLQSTISSRRTGANVEKRSTHRLKIGIVSWIK